ncbi:hypothetical protein [Tunturiibacter gelidoferens]|uniref:Uncharacterized protein n=1 Tax=Tunturiibacter gelidiferens TaxID=3069689 RepID=A0ACC5P2M2_9BACT|nr:hypothetical protein [Edaphobacter lichenicola]MBB5341104.1 hypothetical protein [Edaphobacter lichenicola]
MTSRNYWRTTEAEIVNCRVSWTRSDYANFFDGIQGQSSYIVEYVYEVDGLVYRRGMHTPNPDRVGEFFELEYDPAYPIRNSAPDQTVCLKDPGTWTKYLIMAPFAAGLVYLLNKYL